MDDLVRFYVDTEGEHRWRLRGENGEPVSSGEGHTSERDARRAFVRSVELGVAALIQMAQGDEIG